MFMIEQFLNYQQFQRVQIRMVQMIYNYYCDKIIMNVQQDSCDKKNSTLCKKCSIYYGSEAFKGLCSTCHKKTNQIQKQETMLKSPAETSTPASVAEKQLLQSMEQLTLQPIKKEQKDRKRCSDCNKKIGLLGTECKCGYIFCNSHRLPQNHACQFDHKSCAKERLRKEVIKIYNGKITQI